MENKIKITLDILKENRELYNYIRHKLINKFLYANIGLQEVLEFINSSQELKSQVLFPEQLKYDEFSEMLNQKIKNEITNRIKSGEIEIVKRAMQPYQTFITNTKDYPKAMEIIDNIFKSLNINDDINLLSELFKKISIIQTVTVSIIRDNLNKIKNNDYSFTKNNTTINFINIYFKYSKTVQENNSINEDESIFKNYPNIKNIIKESQDVINVYNYLKNIGLSERVIFVVLLRFDLFEHSPLSISEVSKIFNVSIERIKQDQKAALSSIVMLDKGKGFSKLFPNPTTINNIVTTWYKNGFNKNGNYVNSKKQIKQRASRTLNYQTLDIALGIPPEKLKELIGSFSPADQKFIFTIYDEHFNRIINKMPAEYYTRIKRIKDELIKVYNHPSYDPKNNKYLYKRLNISQEELEKAILELSNEEMIFINKLYDNNWCDAENLEDEELKNQLKIIIKKIRNIIKNSKLQKKKDSRTLYNLLGISLERLHDEIVKLNQNDQDFLNLHYDSEFRRTVGEYTEEERKQINIRLGNIRLKLRKLINNPEYKVINKSEKKEIVIKKQKTLYELLEITKKELIVLISKLNEDDQQFIMSCYDENFIRIRQKGIDKKVALRNNAKATNIRNKIKNMLNPKESKKSKTLYELLEISKERLTELLLRLNQNDQDFINIHYDSEFRRTSGDYTEEERNQINLRLNNIKLKLRKLISDPNYKIRNTSDRKEKDVKKKPTLYEMLGIKKEELVILINKLNEDDQHFIMSCYDENFIRIRQKGIDKRIALKNNTKVTYLKNKLKNMLSPKENKKSKTLYELLEVSKERLTELLLRLNQNDQDFINLHYDSEFRRTTGDYTNEERKQINIRLGNIRLKLRKYINNPDYKVSSSSIKNEKKLIKQKTLYESLGITKEELTILISKLKDKQQQFLKSCYTEDYVKISQKGVDKATAQKNYSYLSYIKSKLKILKEETNQNLTNSLGLVLKTYENKIENRVLNTLEIIISMSIINGQKYSTSSIAKYLGLEEEVVRDLIRNYLLNCKKKYNAAIDEHIEYLYDTPLTLTREKNKNEEGAN